MTAILKVQIGYTIKDFGRIDIGSFVMKNIQEYVGTVFFSEIKTEGSQPDILVKFVKNNRGFKISKFIFDIQLQQDNILEYFDNWLTTNGIKNIWSNNQYWSITFDLCSMTFRSTEEFIKAKTQSLNYFLNK